MRNKRNNFLSLLFFSLLVGCATKDFGQLHEISPSVTKGMTCKDIEMEFFQLSQYEDSVDEEASAGQFKQIFWGGIWSVMADEKLEAVARRDIRKRLRLLYELKVEKGCK